MMSMLQAIYHTPSGADSSQAASCWHLFHRNSGAKHASFAAAGWYGGTFVTGSMLSLDDLIPEGKRRLLVAWAITSRNFGAMLRPSPCSHFAEASILSVAMLDQ